MKKTMVIALAGLFLLTGCGAKKSVCTRKLTTSGVTMDIKATVKYKGSKYDSMEVIYELENKEQAKKVCSVYSKAKCDGKKVIFSGEDVYAIVGMSSKELDGATKKEIEKSFKSGGFKCN